ncbi:hypothetical protein MNBD_NITROSPINAE02-1683 [hydrothermal vent metagenome]|uniref:DUF302 domain-containing protein n=1 Tax=hydrothermal vent metagenome TaxID=652676 RepID=A0A3B1CAD7_9ZZZZ
MDVNSDIVTLSFQDIGFDEFLADLVKAIQVTNYRVVKIVNVDNIHMRTNLDPNLNIGFKNYKIVEICNLMNCNEIISSDLRAGVFMPVRFSVYQPNKSNEILVSYLRPLAVAKLFGSARMLKAAKGIENDMAEIIATASF